MLRDKTVSALVVLALGLTLGAAVCVWAFTDLLTRQPLPYPQADRLVVAQQVIFDPESAQQTRQFSYPAITALHGAAGVFSDVALLDRARDILISHPSQPLAAVTYTTSDYPALFAPPMAMGYFPATAEAATAVLSYAAWQTLFDRRPDILGLSLQTASGNSFEIVGVTAAEFFEPALFGPDQRTQVWLPWRYNPSLPHWGWADLTDTLVLAGRLQPGIDMSQASERLSSLLNTQWRPGLAAVASTHQGWSSRVALLPAGRAIAGNGPVVGAMLLTGTLGLLLIALVNAAHLLIASVARRRQEFAIRHALGAGWSQIFRMVYTDTLMLMTATAAVALSVAALGIRSLRVFAADLLPRVSELAIGWVGVGLTVLAALVLAGLLAAAAAHSVSGSYSARGLNLGRSRISGRPRVLLMIGQVALTGVLLLVGLGLLRETRQVLAQSNALDLQRTASAFLYPRANAGYAEGEFEQGLAKVAERLRALPEVEAVSRSHSPLQDFIRTAVSGGSEQSYPVELKRVDDQYFELIGERLKRGRNFLSTELRRSSDAAVINDALAKMLDRRGGVLGTQLMRGSQPYTVVGVVANMPYPGSPADQPRLYLTTSEAASNLVIRFRPGANINREQLVQFIAQAEPGIGLFTFDDLQRRRADILAPRRTAAVATVLTVWLVMLVSGMGIFGMVSYATGLRDTEIGVRLAFGASSFAIVALLLRNYLPVMAWGIAGSVTIGAVIWVGAAAQLGQYLEWGTRADYATAFAGIAGLILVACVLSIRPALRRSPSRLLSQD